MSNFIYFFANSRLIKLQNYGSDDCVNSIPIPVLCWKLCKKFPIHIRSCFLRNYYECHKSFLSNKSCSLLLTYYINRKIVGADFFPASTINKGLVLSGGSKTVFLLDIYHRIPNKQNNFTAASYFLILIKHGCLGPSRGVWRVKQFSPLPK